MTRSRRLHLGLVLFALVLSGRTHARVARADIPPPPDSPITKRVPFTIEVDWGVFADRVTRKHVVVAGDTLRSLAAKYLGDKERFQVIANANAALAANPDRIRVGDTLWIPPARHAETPPAPVAADQAAPLGPWYEAFWQVWNRRHPPRIGSRASPDAIPEAARSGGTLVLVPHAEAGPLLVARAAEASAAIEAPPGVLDHALYAVLDADTLVHKDDPTVRIVAKHKLAGANQQLVQVETERLRYDAAGALVTRVWDVPRPSFHTAETGERGGAALPDAPPAPSTTTPNPTADGTLAPAGEPAEPPRAPTFAPASTPPAAPAPTATPATVPTGQPASGSATPAPAGEAARSAPVSSERSRGDGSGGESSESGAGAKRPISSLVLIIASLVSLALIGVVVLLRRGASTASAGSPQPLAAPLPAAPLPAVHPPLDSPSLPAPLSFSPASPSSPVPSSLAASPPPPFSSIEPPPSPRPPPPPAPPTPSDPPTA